MNYVFLLLRVFFIQVLGDKDVLFMCHHGTLIVAENIHIAFDDLYYLERACMTQLMAMGAGGREAIKVSFFVLHTFSWKRFILCEGDAVGSAGSHEQVDHGGGEGVAGQVRGQAFLC